MVHAEGKAGEHPLTEGRAVPLSSKFEALAGFVDVCTMRTGKIARNVVEEERDDISRFIVLVIELDVIRSGASGSCVIASRKTVLCRQSVSCKACSRTHLADCT